MRSLFSGIVFEIHPTLKGDVERLKKLQRQIVAGNGEFSNSVDSSFLPFVSDDPATHVLVLPGSQDVSFRVMLFGTVD